MHSYLGVKGAEALPNVHEVGSSDDISSEPSVNQRESRWHANPFKTQNRVIIVVCCLVLLPMAAFTVVLLWMIMAHLVEPLNCSIPELCMSAVQLNQTTLIAADYIVDIPVARLVFIASWSSTLSTTFVGCVMVLYSYVVASKLLQLADEDAHEHAHPNPYQVTLLIRVLNADILVVWDMIRDMFSKGNRRQDKKTKIPGLL
jgi:hypothetical protein